mgnify:CR=1 FL=1
MNYDMYSTRRPPSRLPPSPSIPAPSNLRPTPTNSDDGAEEEFETVEQLANNAAVARRDDEVERVFLRGRSNAW